MALLIWRFAQAGMRVWKGEQQMLIVSHEAEEEVAEAARKLEEQS